MNRSKLIFIFALYFFSSNNSYAFDYQISCQNKSLDEIKTNTPPANSKECQDFIKNGYLKCYDTQKANLNPQAITISTPHDHYYKSKESAFYSRGEIKDLIQQVVKDGNDPYLMLAIILLENPPLLSDKPNYYADSYGQIPLDLIAVADSFGCNMKVTEDRKKIFLNSKKIIKYDLNSSGEDQVVCLNKNTYSGVNTVFYVLPSAQPESCCSEVKISKKDVLPATTDSGARLNPAAKSKLLRIISDQYVKSKFSQSFKSKASLEEAPEKKMATLVQSFNGYGYFGMSEKTNNQCLDKMNMAKMPVYGAGASELMLNSLMNNSEIKSMVAEAVKSNKAKPTSYLCWSYGEGTHTVSSSSFNKLLGQYLGGRKNCPVATNKLKEAKSADSIPKTEKAKDGHSSI